MLGNNNNRWYDQNPKVSLAISLLRNASSEQQVKTANFILEKATDKELSRAKMIKKKSFFTRRWYDYNENLFLAVEFFRTASPERQNDLAMEVINYLCSIETEVLN